MADEAQVAAAGEEFAEEPVFGVVELAEDEEMRVLLEEAVRVLDVGADGEDAFLEVHAVEDGGVREAAGGVGVGEEEDALKGCGRFAVVHLDKGEAAGVDERKAGVERGGEQAGLARLGDGFRGLEGVAAEQHGEAFGEGDELAGDEQGEETGEQGRARLARRPEGQERCGEEGNCQGSDDAVAREEGSVSQHEIADQNAGNGEEGKDRDPLWLRKETVSAAAQGVPAEQDEREQSGEEEDDEFAVDVLDVEAEDVLAGWLEGEGEEGGAMVAEQREVECNREEGSGKGENRGPRDAAAMEDVDELSGGQSGPGEKAEDVAEKQTCRGKEEKQEREGVVEVRLTGALPGEQTQGGEGEEKGIGASFGGELSGQAGEEKRRGTQAEEHTGPTTDEAEEKQHGRGEGDDLRQAAGQGARREGGQA